MSFISDQKDTPIKYIGFDSRENMYINSITENDGTMGLCDVIDHKEYKKESAHHYIRIRRSNGTIGIYESDALYTWVIEHNGRDPITRDDLSHQHNRIRAKKRWYDLFKEIKTFDITIEFKQKILLDYLKDSSNPELTEKARAFVDIATFDSLGLIHKDLDINSTSKFLRINKGKWLMRMSSKHCSVDLNINTRIVVIACYEYQQRVQETDGLGYIALSGYEIGDPMTLKNKAFPCLIDILEKKLKENNIHIKNII